LLVGDFVKRLVAAVQYFALAARVGCFAAVAAGDIVSPAWLMTFDTSQRMGT
jgi:hypothetical protein